MPRRRHKIVALALVLTASAACSGDVTEELASLCPGLPPAVVETLSGENDSFDALIRQAGSQPVLRAWWSLVATLDRHESARDFANARRQILPYLDRIATEMESRYRCDYWSRELERLSGAEFSSWRAGRRVASEMNAIASDEERTPAERAAGIVALVEKADASGDPRLSGRIRAVLADTYARADMDEASLRARVEAFNHYRRAGLHVETCQEGGAIGGQYEVLGLPDSTAHYYDIAKATAASHDLPYHSARISTFYAHHFRRTGRIALAHQLYTDALDAYAPYESATGELRFVLSAARFYRSLGTLGISERLLERARVLLDAEAHSGAALDRAVVADYQSARGLHLLRVGRVEDATSLLQLAVDGYQGTDKIQHPAQLFEQWADGLLAAGQFDNARDVIDRGARLCEDPTLASMRPSFYLQRADALLKLGRVEEARESLARFDSTAAAYSTRAREEGILRDVIRTRLVLAASGREAALDELGASLERMRQSVGRLDVETPTYLWLSQRHDLRDLMRELAGDDVELAYGAELAWRDIASGRRPASDASGLAAQWRRRSREARSRLADDALHCLYVTSEQAVWRYDASRGGVRRTQLAIAPDTLATLANETWQSMRRPPTQPGSVGVALERRLERLAREVLPEQCLDAGTHDLATLLVTADGALSSIPFSAFDTNEGSAYNPLVATLDIAYVRGMSKPAANTPPDRSLVVSTPKLSPGTARRMGLRATLDEAMAEAAEAARVLPGAQQLQGADATRRAVIGEWENHAYLYVAAHVLRDPDAPFLTLLPLAPPAGSVNPRDEFIDVGDILSADLANCRVVVLSGCSTGAPYVARGGTGPSLGDAFLDAGAGAAVQTFWDVEDGIARESMSAFLRHWRGAGRTPTDALSETHRERSHAGAHPYHWAAYSVTLGRL